ncbi:Calx-beta domain-containing protein, partial [Flagellimonas sp. DF-77]|uniref:Calx-beta domain-containing protein n=1 Tax=Flagellimonas algarum TaxID=3230298 RepID=UPI0033929820
NIVDGNATGTITDNDNIAGVGIDFLNDDVTVNEADGTLTFTVVLTGSVQGGFTLDYTTNDGTALATEDYTATSNTLTFAGTDGETHDITIPIIDDNLIETLENFVVDLSNLSTILISIIDDQATGNIIDNDNDPSLGVQFDLTSIDVNEDAGTVSLDVSL